MGCNVVSTKPRCKTKKSNKAAKDWEPEDFYKKTTSLQLDTITPTDVEPDDVTIPAESAVATQVHSESKLRHLLSKFLRPSILQGSAVLLDQAGYSIVTFITATLVARACTKLEYGSYVLGLTLVFFCGVIQHSLVDVPFAVLSQKLTGRRHATYLGSTFLQHLCLGLLIALCFTMAWGVSRLFSQTGEVIDLLLPLAAVAVGIHFKTFMRSMLIAKLRPWTSLAMGIVINTITVGGVVTLYAADYLTARTAFLVMAFGSVVPAALALLMQRRSLCIRRSKILSDFAKNWRYGKWIFAATGANVGGIRLLPWLTLLWCGREIVALVGVITMSACIIRPAIEAFAGYLTPKLANYAQSNGFTSTRKKVILLVKLAIIIGGFYVVFMFLFGDYLVGILYTARYQGYAVALTIIAAAISFKVVDVPIRVFLMAMNQPKTVFHSSIIASLITLVTAVVVIPQFGVVGVALAMMTHYIVSLCVNYLGMVLWLRQLVPCTKSYRKNGMIFRKFFGREYTHSGAREITYNETSVAKKIHPKYAGMEIAVTEAAHNVAKASGVFYVPRILRKDPDAGVIEFERIDGLVSLRDLFAAETDVLDLLNRAGRTLAYTHEHLELPEELKIKVTLGWECEDSDLVCFHGDFNINNVCYQQQQDRIVVLDWASVGVVSRGKTVGSRYFDLGKFLRSLLCQQYSLLGSISNFNKRAFAFLDGYQHQLGRNLDYCLARKYLLKMATRRIQIQLRQKQLKRALGNSVAYLVLWVLSAKWKAFNVSVRSSFWSGLASSEMKL